MVSNVSRVNIMQDEMRQQMLGLKLREKDELTILDIFPGLGLEEIAFDSNRMQKVDFMGYFVWLPREMKSEIKREILKLIGDPKYKHVYMDGFTNNFPGHKDRIHITIGGHPISSGRISEVFKWIESKYQDKIIDVECWTINRD